MVASVAWLNIAQAKGSNLVNETSGLLSYLENRKAEKELEVVKATDPKKLITASAADTFSSVSGSDAENTVLNAESAAITSMQIVYANDINEAAVLPGGEEAAPTSYQERHEILEYVVQPGDTVSTIARQFGLDSRILLKDRNWEETIKPGEIIGIPPSNNPIHQVAHNHNISDIAQRYGAKVDDIIEYNDLPDDGTVQPGQILIIPGGKIEDKPAPPPTPAPTSTRRLATASRSSNTSSSRTGSAGRTTTVTGRSSGIGGWCTDYAWSRRPDLKGTVRGNAGTWLSSAKANGIGTGGTPRPGAVQVSSESSWGHVAVVEEVYADGSYLVSEQNYKGYGVVSQRKMPANSGVVKGFVY